MGVHVVHVAVGEEVVFEHGHTDGWLEVIRRLEKFVVWELWLREGFVVGTCAK